MPEPQFPRGLKNGINLAFLRKAQKKNNFSLIKNFFLLSFIQNFSQSIMRIIHFHINDLKLFQVVRLGLSVVRLSRCARLKGILSIFFTGKRANRPNLYLHEHFN